MDSRERVSLALDFQEPDRVPIDFWGSRGFFDVLDHATGMNKEAFLDLHDVDFRYLEGPHYIGPVLQAGNNGAEADLWGVMRKSVSLKTACGTETYQEVCFSPLEPVVTVEEIEAYDKWPSPDWFDYTPIADQCRAIHERGRVTVFMGDRLNRIAQLKPAMYLRGTEQIFMDMAMAPEIAEAIFRRLRIFYAEYLRRILEAADELIDIVLTGDDFGAQNGPLVSPGMWEKSLADGFAKYMEIISAYGARSMHHTCGMVTPLVPAMVERGLNVLQSLQPEAMAADLPELKRTYGQRLAFHGGISIQSTLPHGTPDDVRNEVKARIATLAPGGGYILGTAHNIQSDCPMENVNRLMAAYHEFGYY